MSTFESAQLAIQSGNMQLALKAVQKLQPADLRKIIQYALLFDSDVALAVIALAETLLLVAQLEAQLNEAKNVLTGVSDSLQPAPPSNDDEPPHP